MFIKEVKTKLEFQILMKKLEREMPNLRWRDGQRPTEWASSNYPKKIYIQDSSGKLACWESLYDNF